MYANKSNVKGIDSSDKTIKQKIYERYTQAYKKGVFNYIKDTGTRGMSEPKKYFSGGISTHIELSKANVEKAVTMLKQSNNARLSLKVIAKHSPQRTGTIERLGMADKRKGGIDLKDTAKNIRTHVDGPGVQFTLDHDMIEEVKRVGINGLTPVILTMTPVDIINLTKQLK